MGEDNNKSFDIKKIALFGGPIGCASAFFIFFPLFVVVLLVLGLFEGGNESSGNVVSSSGECGFTISETSLSKSEFKRLIQEYANTHSQWSVFADYADDYYDYAKAKGVNPELVIVVASKEGNGYETKGSNNYWGLRCPNGSSACASFSSFMEGAKELIDSASNYDTLRDWFEKGSYSYIGYFWYNPGNSGDGGCYYAPYIYPDDMPTRVKNACNGPTCVCYLNSDYSSYQTWKNTGVNPRPECTPTTDEDQAAYTTWLINDKMAKPREIIFGLAPNEGVSCTSKANGIVEEYVEWMINIANDNTHGYNQDNRILSPDVDCSSFVYYALLKSAGFSQTELGGSWPFTTYDMVNILKNLGFKVYKYTSENDLQRGDILWRTQHTEVYIGNGQNVGAHWNYDGVSGDSSGDEVDIGSNDGNWISYIRYEGND